MTLTLKIYCLNQWEKLTLGPSKKKKKTNIRLRSSPCLITMLCYIRFYLNMHVLLNIYIYVCVWVRVRTHLANSLPYYIIQKFDWMSIIHGMILHSFFIPFILIIYQNNKQAKILIKHFFSWVFKWVLLILEV